MLLVSHDRELLARGADRIVTLETGAAGSTAWVHGGGFATYHAARADRMDRLDELRRRWDEQHAKIKALVAAMKVKATASDEFASRYRAAQTRLAKFEEAGPPQERPPEQDLQLRLRGARTGKRAVIAERLELTGLMKPFDLEVWFGDRVAVLGSNGSGKSHFLRLLARGGTDPDARLGHITSAGAKLEPVAHTGRGILGARVVPGWFAQTHRHPEFVGRTLLELLHRGDENRPGMPRDAASSALDRYGLVGQALQSFETLSGGQQARFQILLLELSGTTLLLLDEPTDNLDLASAEALESALARFEGTVLAVTHDRWFARSFDRFLVFGADGAVYESDEPVWDEGRVARAREWRRALTEIGSAAARVPRSAGAPSGTRRRQSGRRIATGIVRPAFAAYRLTPGTRTVIRSARPRRARAPTYSCDRRGEAMIQNLHLGPAGRAQIAEPMRVSASHPRPCPRRRSPRRSRGTRRTSSAARPSAARAS